MEGSETVGNCKELIRRGEGMPPDKQHLVFKGKKLEDGRAMVPPLCTLQPRERTPGACRPLAGGCGQGQGQAGRRHPIVHRSSRRAVGGCTPFAGGQCGQGHDHIGWQHLLFIAAQTGRPEVARLLLGSNVDKDKAMQKWRSLQLRRGSWRLRPGSKEPCLHAYDEIPGRQGFEVLPTKSSSRTEAPARWTQIG